MDVNVVPPASAELLPVLLAGLLAGLGVALPLGGVGVLLLQEGMSRGRRAALRAATGVAIVDMAYALVAVLAGRAVAELLDGRQSQVRLVCAAALAGLAARGLIAVAGERRDPGAAPVTASGHSAFWRFVALTALNPLTAGYFTVLAAGLGEDMRRPISAVAFVLGVFAGSWCWQAVLALAGALAGARLPDRARTWTSVAGYGVLLVLAAALARSA